MSLFGGKVKGVEQTAPTPPPNAPRQANASVISSGTRSRTGDSGTSSLIATSPTGLNQRAQTTRRRKTLGGS